MAMSPAQVAAFESGSGVAMADLSNLVVYTAAALILLWLAWEIFGLYKAWAERSVDVHDAAWAVIRAALWTMMLTWIVHP